jgi:hypothetical protein
VTFVRVYTNLLSVQLVRTGPPDAFCCLMVLVMLPLLMRCMRYTCPSLVIVTTWPPDALCCVMLVSADFFEQLTKATVIVASATSDVWFFIVSNQRPCSWKGFASCRLTRKLTRAGPQTSSIEQESHRGVECSDLVKPSEASFPARSVRIR